ncbi:terpene synthase family protein [Nocardia sp. KC 131]
MSFAIRERFLDSLEEWFEACEREAHHRINGYISASADYLPLPMSTGGSEVTFAAVYEQLTNGVLWANQSDRHTQTSTSAAPDLETLAR